LEGEKPPDGVAMKISAPGCQPLLVPLVPDLSARVR